MDLNLMGLAARFGFFKIWFMLLFSPSQNPLKVQVILGKLGCFFFSTVVVEVVYTVSKHFPLLLLLNMLIFSASFVLLMMPESTKLLPDIICDRM